MAGCAPVVGVRLVAASQGHQRLHQQKGGTPAKSPGGRTDESRHGLQPGRKLAGTELARECRLRRSGAAGHNWFELGMRLNPYDTYNPMRYGMCLHWMGRHAEAEPFFEKALKLDPNNYYVVAHEGWHRVQLGDYAGAKLWFEKSLK